MNTIFCDWFFAMNSARNVVWLNFACRNFIFGFPRAQLLRLSVASRFPTECFAFDLLF